MIVNQIPYPLSFAQEKGQTLIARYGEEGRQYVMQPDVDVSGLVASLQIVKPDNTFVIASADIVEPEEGPSYIVCTIPLQATVVKGIGHYSLYIQDDADMIIYSAEGQIWVDDHLITDEMLESIAEVYGLRFPQDFLTVDMIPTLEESIKQSILNDEEISETSTWTSNKINDIVEDIEDEIAGLTVDIIYSLDEQKIGKWINGKDLYKKTVVQTSGFSTSYSFSHGIADIDEIVNVEGLFYSTTPGYSYKLNDNVPVSGYHTCISDIGRTSIQVYIGAGRLSMIGALKLTFYYTKL